MAMVNIFRNNQGAAAVEFALVLPLLLFVVFGIIEFGFLLYDKAVITNASREAARRACVFDSPGINTVIPAVVSQYGNLPIQIPAKSFTASDVSITPDPATASSGTYITATVRYSYTFFIIPDLGALFPGGSSLSTVSLTGTTVMRRE